MITDEQIEEIRSFFENYKPFPMTMECKEPTCKTWSVGNDEFSVRYNGFSESWRKNDDSHREDGPSILSSQGEFWHLNGKCHRIGGPAKMYFLGEYSVGLAFWFQNGERHREDGPALLQLKQDPRMEWWQNGEYHRVDGPAIINREHLCWYQRGKLHRDNGPAIIWKDGRTEYWSHGNRFFPKYVYL